MFKHLNINRRTVFLRKIKIYGRVQGIFFRVTAKEKAETLDITGFAKNESDGSVYVEAEGEEEKLDQFLVWCRKGPSLAEVEEVEVTEGTIKNFSEFEVY